jgi:hypothetical protein
MTTLSNDEILQRARLPKGRFVWLARLPFAIASIGGGALLIGLKILGVSQVPVTAAACAIIGGYCLIVSFTPNLRIREDQLGDNCYYLGFLFTLASLAYALYQFGVTGNVEEIVANFGLALGSTIWGILLRVLINQARRDVLETEQDARMALAEAVVRLRTEIDDAVLALGSFCRNVQQAAQEQINTSTEQTAKVLNESIAKVGQSSAGVMDRIDAAFLEFREHAQVLNESSGATVKSLKTLLSRIDKIDAPSDLVTRRLEPALSVLDESVGRLRKRLDTEESLATTVLDHVAKMTERLELVVAGVGALGASLNASADSAKLAVSASENAAKSLELLSASMSKSPRDLEVSLEETGRRTRALMEEHFGSIAATLNAGRADLASIVELMRSQNSALAAELERSGQLVIKTSSAMTTLADSIVERLS